MAPNLFQQRGAALDEVARLEELKAKAYAEEAKALAALVALYPGDDSLLLELAGTARIGQHKPGGQAERATRLVDLFPVALRLLSEGELLVGTAQLLLALTKSCSDGVQQELDRRLSARVAGMDAVDARALISATVVEVEAQLDREEQERRYARARADRGVWVKPVEDGMARIGAEVDAVAAKEFALGLEALDRAQAVADERSGVVRTKAQRMADLLTELPARHLGLLEALRSGRGDALLAEALHGAPDGEPAGEAPRPWELTADELAVALLRLPVRRPRVLNVHVAASTLLDLDDRACVVEGLGALPGWVAQALLPDAALRRVLVDRATGQPLHLGDTVPPVVELDVGHGPPPPDGPPGSGPEGPEPPPGRPPGPELPHDAHVADDRAAEALMARAHADRRRLSAVLLDPALPLDAEPQYAPSARLRALVQVRDLRCVGPGCARTATACDLDHETPYGQGGATAAANLSAKSRRCHGARHRGWDVARDPATGVTRWTSPLGRVYTRLPAWRPPPALPADLLLGAPAPRPRVLVPTSYPEDRLLWPEPPPAPAPAAAAPTPAPAPAAGPRRSWDDGGPPPF